MKIIIKWKQYQNIEETHLSFPEFEPKKRMDESTKSFHIKIITKKIDFRNWNFLVCFASISVLKKLLHHTRQNF